VSYDLALWADVPPFAELGPDDAYTLLSDLMEDDGAHVEPVTVINDLVRSLLDRWPALGEPGDEKSPWVTGPEIGHASGASIYITLSFSGADVAVPVIVAEARDRGLICYDPQRRGVI